jgi:hypothetical protein
MEDNDGRFRGFDDQYRGRRRVGNLTFTAWLGQASHVFDRWHEEKVVDGPPSRAMTERVRETG